MIRFSTSSPTLRPAAACGICACTGGVFHDCYNVIGGVDKAIPVDVYAPGCAVRPEQIIDAVAAGVAKLDEKSAALEGSVRNDDL